MPAGGTTGHTRENGPASRRGAPPRSRRRVGIGIAGLLACCTVVLALGIVGSAPAASTANVTITANIQSATNLSSAGCATGTANVTDFGSLLPGASTVTSADCAVVFGSNNDTAMLRAYQLDGRDKSMFRPPTGPLDTTYSGDGVATAIVGSSGDYTYGTAVQPDGKIVAAGVAWNGANQDVAVARFTTAGVLDTSFDTDGSVMTTINAWGETGRGVALQPDGKIVVGGYTQSGTDDDLAIVRYNSNGSLDNGFDTDGKVQLVMGGTGERANGVAVQADGKIVAAGTSGNNILVARYTAAGAPDTTCDGDGVFTTQVGGSSNGNAMAIQPDGRIVVVGYGLGASNDFAAIRLDTSCALDSSFDTDGKAIASLTGNNDEAYAVAIQDDGKIVVAGKAGQTPNEDVGVVRLTAAGALDAAFDTDGKVITNVAAGDDRANAVAIQPDGRILVAGGTAAGTSDLVTVRYTATGALDTSFDSDGIRVANLGSDDAITSLAWDSDGRLVGGGYTSSDTTTYRFESVAVADFASGTTDWSTGTNMFGACLRSVASGASTDGSSWTADTGDADCADGNADPWKPIVATSGTAGAKVAVSAGAGTTNATANLRFGLRSSASQGAGSYMAPVVLEVVAPMV